MKCLVTGAAGFLGYHLSRLLLDQGHEVVLADNFVRGEADDLFHALCAHPNATGLCIDLTDFAAVRGLPGDVEVVFHLAALNGTQNFYERPFEVARCCTLPTFALLDRYRDTKLTRFVYAGTSEAYAATVTRFDWPVPTAEDVPLSVNDVFNPRWSYAASKLAGEIATVNGCRQFGLPFTIIRYHNAYGPRMGDKHVIPDFLARARDGIFALYGYEETRSFLYAEDAVRATAALAECEAASGEVVNVGGAREITMYALAETMMRVCGFSGRVALHPAPPGSVARRAPDLTKLHRLVGNQETVSLEDGLARTASFYLGQTVAA